MPSPIYSHGGPTVGSFISVPGTTTNSGRPVSIVQANGGNPCMNIFFSGTSCTVFIEGNGGLIDNTGNPPSGEWIDYTGGSGYNLTNGNQLSKFLPNCVPYWRTRISAIVLGVGSGLVSYIPVVVGPDGVIISACYPRMETGLQSYST